LRKEWLYARGKEESIMLSIDYQIILKTHGQHTTYLLDHMIFVSAALRAVHHQKKRLFEERQLVLEKRLVFCEQWQALSGEESALLQELRVILAEITAVREQTAWLSGGNITTISYISSRDF
jgi:hypothetical protein